MLPPIAPFLDPKEIIRQRMSLLRGEAAAARPDAGAHAARIFMENIERPDGAVISLYHPIKDEIDTGPLLDALLDRAAGKNRTRIALPVVAKKKAPLVFREFRPGDELVEGAYGVMTPLKGAPEITPDILVVPLLAFTKDGGRLGYGGGYYDRTLAGLRKSKPVIAVGYAYGAQEVDALPLSRLDEPLDFIVTEREIIAASSGASKE